MCLSLAGLGRKDQQGNHTLPYFYIGNLQNPALEPNSKHFVFFITYNWVQ
jgi:hypothetical protein